MLLAPPAPRQLEPALTCEQESSDDLKSENAILRAQNEQLRQQVNEITEQLQTVTSKFNSSQEENQTLLMINNEFSLENDKLYESLERYRSVKLPRSLQTAVRKDPELELDEEFRPHKRQKSEKKQKHKQKRGKRLTKRSYDNESSSEDESSSDESEMDEKKARAEMKTILKTVPKTSLHKTRRSRNIYRNKGQLDADNRRLHANNRLNEKKIRRMKSAKSLYANNNSEISKYNKEELLKILKNRKYHSPEISESDDDPVNQNKRIICVYDLSWRSDELKMLLRDILDPHSFTIQIARLTRERNYDDELQSYDHPHPPNAPEWSYIEQIDQVYDTEIEGSKTPVYGDNEDSIVGNMPVYDDNEDSIMYNTDEEYAHGESSTTGMIRRAILEADSQQKDKNKKIE
ncbi:hypothetical protein GLOIN_2v1773969 [Rhizophagus irregularis DAOM 181602=DAOM 197198]|nr:hypothetical protein GLOIN_2v1773969 [Rhizophagus irregularis DAOM 181602=DAOM 197198]